MKKYEAILILDSQKVDDSGDAFVKDVEAAIVELGGKIVKTDRMGRKQFAAPIKKKTAGLYWNLVFEAEQDSITKLKTRYCLNATVLRLQVFVYDKPEVTVLEKIAKKKEAAKA